MLVLRTRVYGLAMSTPVCILSYILRWCKTVNEILKYIRFLVPLYSGCSRWGLRCVTLLTYFRHRDHYVKALIFTPNGHSMRQTRANVSHARLSALTQTATQHRQTVSCDWLAQKTQACRGFSPWAWQLHNCALGRSSHVDFATCVSRITSPLCLA